MVGQAGIVVGPIPSECIYPDILIRVKPSTEVIDPLFFVKAWNSKYVREQLERKANTTNGTYKISGEDVRNISLVVPPPQEQAEIVSHLETTEQRFAELEQKTESQITLLQERRTALISAAVTGKIDVRDWQTPAQAT